MSALNMHRNRLQRLSESAVKDEREIAAIDSKIAKKQGDLAKAKTPAAQNRISDQLLRLYDDRAAAQKSLARHRKQASDVQERITSDERAERKKAERQRKRADRTPQRSLTMTAESMTALDQRVSSVERSLIERVRNEIAAEPGYRDHDVFLSYADPDEQVAQELHIRLVARGLSVWFAPFSRRLGDSLTRQLDKGIASSKIGVPLVTEHYLEGRYWTEKEYGAFFSTRKRIIPVLHGVDHAALGRYSPMLADLLGLSTAKLSLDDIADDIAEALDNPDCLT